MWDTDITTTLQRVQDYSGTSMYFKMWSIAKVTVILQTKICTLLFSCEVLYKFTDVIYTYIYTGCPRRNVPDFERVFLMLKYTDITQNTYVRSWTVMEIMAREKCGLLAGPRTVPVSWQSYPYLSLSVVSYDGNSANASPKLHMYFFQGDIRVHVVAALWMVGRLVVRSC